MGIVKSTPFQMKKVAGSESNEERMFITKKHLSRRTFLQGAGATLALPFLESMVPALTAQTAAQTPARVSDLSTCRTARSWTGGRRRPKAPASSSRRS